MYKNKRFQSIQNVKAKYYARMDAIEDVMEQVERAGLDLFFAHTNDVAFKVLHPLFFKGYQMASERFSETPIDVVGLDVETDATTGKPMLFGFSYPSGSYVAMDNPTLEAFFRVVQSLADNSRYNLAVWGLLDIQCILRLFAPTQAEREAISMGLSANVVNGRVVGDPPIFREIGDCLFYVASYLPGRALKLGYIEGERAHTLWVYNVSQFYPGILAKTAKGLKLEWTDFPKDTHVIDWVQYKVNPLFQALVRKSNEQDCRIARVLLGILQDRFFSVFACYPKLLVSTGSLTDAACSKIMGKGEDYQSTASIWLGRNVWDKDAFVKLETLLAEAFSAGYVDQFAMGYFPSVWAADISSAYPFQIRQLPDLRESELFAGSGELDRDLYDCQLNGLKVFTAVIRGIVTIPDSLRFHPITIKTHTRDNFRPTGTFRAAYLLEEREYCKARGATFSEESYVVILLRKIVPAPLSKVSILLGDMRERIRIQMLSEMNVDTKALLDGQQFLVKVVDNSIYGKTVMTTEVVENQEEGKPQIVGYVGGDKFNMLYGSVITARTRIKLAEACWAIAQAGGQPVMAMTDCVYWYGPSNCLPIDSVASVKTAGFFEPPEELQEFYLVKSGQYEYQKHGVWEYKVRGLHINWEELEGGQSFFRRIIRNHCEGVKSFVRPKDIMIPISTRRLISIGSHEVESLGLLRDGQTMIRPFVLSTKQKEMYIFQWKQCLNGHVWLGAKSMELQLETALEFPTEEYEKPTPVLSLEAIGKRNRINRKANIRQDLLKLRYLNDAIDRTGFIPPTKAYKLPWETLEGYYGIPRKVEG